MQKTFFSVLRALTLATGLAAIGCGFGSSPSKVARRFFQVVEKGDYKSFSKVMTPETAREALNRGERARAALLVKGGVAATREENVYKTDSFGIVDELRMTVHVTFKDGSATAVNLRKIDGKWKVHEID